jgi:DNA-damage-inducible protein D
MEKQLIVRMQGQLAALAQEIPGEDVEYWFAQSYFTIQPRKQELIEERIQLQERLQASQKLRESETELSKNLYDRGVDDRGFGLIRSKGDAALFGGKTTGQMKSQLGVPKSRPLADFLPTVTITAKNLATEITNYNVRRDDLQGEFSITAEHIQNNKGIRSVLIERGIQSEALPPEEDLKKLERRVRAGEKALLNVSALPENSKGQQAAGLALPDSDPDENEDSQ